MIIFEIDGSYRPQTRESKAGIVILEPGKKPERIRRNLRRSCSNNYEAEFKALKIAMEIARKRNLVRILIRCDCLMVVAHMTGKVRKKTAPRYRELKKQCHDLAKTIAWLRIVHIPRRMNSMANVTASRDQRPQRTKIS